MWQPIAGGMSAFLPGKKMRGKQLLGVHWRYTMIRIIGQELDFQVRAPQEFGEYRILEGIGLSWPEYYPQLACWTGIGPHSIGASRLPTELNECDCITCGADWFVPFLMRLKTGHEVALNEIEAAHVERFGQPMLQMEDHDVFLTKFFRFLSSGRNPEGFFPCCRIVKVIWNEAAQIWQVVPPIGDAH
jgi:hypothetical protein